jgi:hypothetical protein
MHAGRADPVVEKYLFASLQHGKSRLKRQQAVTASSFPGITQAVAGTLKRTVSMGKTSDSAPGVVLGSEETF